MKTIALALLAAAIGFSQNQPQPAQTTVKGGITIDATGHDSGRRHGLGSGPTIIRAVVNTSFSAPLPALAGETGCSLTILNGPKSLKPQGWKLAGNVFSGTPAAPGFYRLNINCTKPAAVTQMILLNVTRTAPQARPAVAAPAPIPLN
jgi:hypothetical protein